MIYHVCMSNAANHAVEADSAADAIQSALEQHRGLTVTKCWRGNGDAGINYEVPKHSALPVEAKQPKRKPAREPQLF